MSSIDIRPIPEEAEKWSGDIPRRLDRIELREDSQRRLVRAVFSYTNTEGETSRTLSWDQSAGQYYLEGRVSDRAAILRILDLWKEMLGPSDFELIKEQLGVIDGAREDVNQALGKS
ncbi:MAG: hypothetical protein V1880_02045 [Patescibacteria group bacterium]